MSSKLADHTAPAVLFVTPECAPLVKTGGLGDVSASLPPALRAIGVDCRVLLPGYPAVMAHARGGAALAEFVILGQSVRLIDSALPNGVPLIVLECPALYERAGGPYQSDEGNDWEDNALRFGVLSRVAALLGSTRTPISWLPRVVHCHDWPAALAPVYLAHERAAHAASLVTIHNLAFQGVFDFSRIGWLELPHTSLGIEGLEFYGRISFLKGGLVYSDAINTVSPTYAQEIQTEALGFGLDGVLRKRQDRLFGVLNGIDTALWNPATDDRIAARYDAGSLEKKAENKSALRERMGLAHRDVPVMGMVTRLTHQKGIDLVEEAVEDLLRLPAQLVIVGSGEKHLVARLRALQMKHSRDIGVFIGFDESLAHLVEAGADMFLMPSRFEPCGMNQMYSQRYGTPPIANATGGLVDTVFDETRAIDAAPTGFLMDDATREALLAAAGRAVTAFRDPARWRALQVNGMSRDFGWTKAAREYLQIYENL